MKLLLHCTECSDDIEKPLLVEVEDKGVYLVTCENGHQAIYTLSNPKFEVLFEMVLLALLDGYTRETVVTLAAAVEEFHRLFIKITLVKKNVYSEDWKKESKDFWRRVNVSERQLGAFSALYFLEKGQIPTFPDDKSTEFRNAVVHKGKIPKHDEVMQYGEKVVKFLVPLWKEQQAGSEHMLVVGMDILRDMKDEHKLLKKFGSLYPTTISRMLGHTEYSFDKAVEMVREGSSWLKNKYEDT